MNSSFYECRVMHHRLSPKEHRFSYRIFMFCLDLAEIDELQRNLQWFSRNRWNLYAFFDQDHLQLSSANIQENIREYVRNQGVEEPVSQVFLVTLPRVLGYVFNPASFYYCFGADGRAIAAVAQVGNTFGEMKLYFLKDRKESDPGHFILRETKHFYVSPFFDHDLQFAFDLQVPNERLVVQIDDYQEGRRVLHTTVTGKRRALTDRHLLQLLWKYPLVTLKVIAGIHWEAFRLWQKGLPFHRKMDHAHLQKNIHRVNVGRKAGISTGSKTNPVDESVSAGIN